MKKNTFVIIITTFCAIAIIVVWYKVNQNTKNDIYPKGDFTHAAIVNMRGDSHSIEMSKQQADTIIEMLRKADKKKDTKMNGLKKYHATSIFFDFSATHFYIDDNTKALYYIIQKATKDGEGYSISSEELSNYLDDIFNSNI